MAEKSPHLRQWLHNRRFVQTIDPEFPDWIVTAIFYTALHSVDTLLMHDHVRSITSHDARNNVLMRTNRYRRIWQAYQPLYSLSRTVRYLANPHVWIPANRIQVNVIDRYLAPIEKSVRKLANVDVTMPEINIRPIDGRSSEAS